MTDGDTYYEVDYILCEGRKLGELLYYVKWKNYAVTESTWVKAEDFVKDAPSAVESWNEKKGVRRSLRKMSSPRTP